MTDSQTAVHVFEPSTVEGVVELGLNFKWVKSFSGNEPGVLVTANTAIEGVCDYRVEATKDEFLKAYPTLESLLYSFSENPEIVDPDTSSTILSLSLVMGMDGIYELPEKRISIDCSDLNDSYEGKFKNNINNWLRKLHNKACLSRVLGKQYLHHYDESNLTNDKLGLLHQVGVNLEFYWTQDINGNDTGLTYIASFAEGESLVIASYESVDDFKQRVDNVNDLVKDISLASDYIKSQVEPGLLYLKSIKENRELYSLTKYSPYVVYLD